MELTLKRIIFTTIIACSILANHAVAMEHLFMCYGKGTYNGEGLDASNGMKLIIEKDESEVFYTFCRKKIKNICFVY